MDIYKLPNGTIIPIDQMTEPPVGAILWQGFDYQKQEWIFEGKKDTRTLEELRKGRPEEGKIYALTGATGKPCIANGNTWQESIVNA